MRQSCRGRPRCEAADCWRKVSAARSASARLGLLGHGRAGLGAAGPDAINDIIDLGTVTAVRYVYSNENVR